MNRELRVALDELERDKAGILPSFLAREELDECLAAWHRLWNLPDRTLDNNRFITNERLYDEPAFARLATHPVVQEAARRVIGEFQLAGYSVVATPHNAKVATTAETVRFHIDHCVYSDVPVPQARDTFVCIWVNFEELCMENGPFALAVRSHHDNFGWEKFRALGEPFVSPRAADWNWKPVFNIGAAGTTAVYSGKTWHAGTGNASEVVRKGLNMNFVPKHPLDCRRRNLFDICALDRERYARLSYLIGSPEYLIACDPGAVSQSERMQ